MNTDFKCFKYIRFFFILNRIVLRARGQSERSTLGLPFTHTIHANKWLVFSQLFIFDFPTLNNRSVSFGLWGKDSAPMLTIFKIGIKKWEWTKEFKMTFEKYANFLFFLREIENGNFKEVYGGSGRVQVFRRPRTSSVSLEGFPS